MTKVEKLNVEERLNRETKRVQPVTVRKMEDNPRGLTFTASTESPARDGDIIEVDGWSVEQYMTNPVVLWMHDPHTPPIGKALAARKVTGDSPRLELDIEFDVDEFADRILGLYERGFLSAGSVGFLPKAFRKPDDEERAELGLGPWGVIWTKAELLEFSAVSVPSDPGALLQNAIDPQTREDLVMMRGMAGEAHRAGFDALLGALEEETRDEVPDVVSGPTRDDVTDLTDAVRDLTDTLRSRAVAVEGGVHYVDLSVTPDAAPERSEGEESDFYGGALRSLNSQLKKEKPE